MTNYIKSGALAIVILTLFSCNDPKIPVEVKKVLQKAGDNKGNLIQVIKHYNDDPADSLKLKAVYFLIANMEGLFYYEGELLRQYQNYFKLIRQDKECGEFYMESFNKQYGPFSYYGIKKKYDLNEVKPNQLIGNIEMAFKVWKEQPWGIHISFDQFCEYILPYRIYNETPAYNRKEIYEQFDSLLNSVRKLNGDVRSACIAINTDLKNPQWLFSGRTTFLPHYPAATIIKYKVGTCREMTDLAFYTMRAVGIPSTIDFVPQWPYRGDGHEFNALLNKDGKMITFLGAEDNPGNPHKPLTKKAKVYRNTYSINPNSLYVQKEEKEIIPELLNNPRLKDVTEEYVKCFDAKVKLEKVSKHIAHPKHAYIAVFNNKDWVIIDWGNVINGEVTFNKMEGGIMYIAGYYDEKSLIPASSPFLLTEDGKIEFFQFNPKSLNPSVTLDRVFPVTVDSYDTWNIGGGSFQGANNSDFSDAEILYTVPFRPNPFWNEIDIHTPNSFRYIRFLVTGTTNIGELEFYSKGKKLKGKPFGTAPMFLPESTFEKAFDADIFTSFDARGVDIHDSTWLGMELTKKEHIDKIRFSPAAQDDVKNKIINGHTYRLQFWENAKWTILGEQVAKASTVTFDNIPSDCLFFIKDISDKTINSRIFIYSNGTILWF